MRHQLDHCDDDLVSAPVFIEEHSRVPASTLNLITTKLAYAIKTKIQQTGQGQSKTAKTVTKS